MRILSTLAVAVIAAAGFLGTARAEEKAAEAVTLKGTLQCAKCSLKIEGVTKCADTLTVKEGDKSVLYYVTGAAHQCQGTKADVELKGTVAEKDGKKTLTVAK
jgi:hypothetical protein